jgi:hypothetical protein
MLDTSHAEDLDVKSLGRHVRTRLYFTSETHLHTLLNVLRFGHLNFPGLPSATHLSAVVDDEGEEFISSQAECCYLTHIVIRVFENIAMPKSDPSRFRVELSFSPGANREPINFDDGGVEPCKSYSPISSKQSPEQDIGQSFSEAEQKIGKNKGDGFDNTKKSYFENNPSDAEDESRLQVAKAQLLNRSQPCTAADLERFFEAAITIAESPIDFQTPRLAPQVGDQKYYYDTVELDEIQDRKHPSHSHNDKKIMKSSVPTWLLQAAIIGASLFVFTKVVFLNRS